MNEEYKDEYVKQREQQGSGIASKEIVDSLTQTIRRDQEAKAALRKSLEEKDKRISELESVIADAKDTKRYWTFRIKKPHIKDRLRAFVGFLPTRLIKEISGGLFMAVVFLLIGIALGPTIINAANGINETSTADSKISQVLILMAEYLPFFYYLGIVLSAMSLIWMYGNYR